MKKVIISTIICFLTSLTLYGQTGKKTYKKFTDPDFKIGDVIIAPHIIFEMSRCSVRPESKDSVKTIADFINQHPSFKIEVGVHTDSRGNTEWNIKASQCRANELLLFLNQTFNISKDNMISKGYGNTELLVSDAQIKKISDKTKEGKLEKETLHQKNRRVEIKILGT